MIQSDLFPVSDYNYKPTQAEKVLRYCRDVGSITALEAMKEFGIMRLGARIWELERNGFLFEHKTEAGKNRYGDKTHYTRYILHDTY